MVPHHAMSHQDLFQAEQRFQPKVHAAESHEGQRQQSCRYEYDRHASHALGDIDVSQLLAYSGEEDKSQREADGRGERVNNALDEREVLLYHENGHAKHGAVGGDEWQEYSERLVEGGRDLLEDYLNHLHERRYDQDERYGLEILQAERVEHAFLQQESHHGGHGQHESHGHAHAE